VYDNSKFNYVFSFDLVLLAPLVPASFQYFLAINEMEEMIPSPAVVLLLLTLPMQTVLNILQTGAMNPKNAMVLSNSKIKVEPQNLELSKIKKHSGFSKIKKHSDQHNKLQEKASS